VATLAISLERDELNCILTALDWYIDDLVECAAFDERAGFDGAEDSMTARQAAALLRRLQDLGEPQ